MSLSQRVVDYLKARKLSQSEFCEMSKYKPSNLSNIVRGRTKYPKIDFLQAILRIDQEVDIKIFLKEDDELDDNPFVFEDGSKLSKRDVLQTETMEKMWSQMELMKDQIEFLQKQLERCQKEKDDIKNKT